MKNKAIIFGIIFIIVLGIGFFVLGNKQENTNFGENIISNEEGYKEIVKKEDDGKLSLEDENQIRASLRVLCSMGKIENILGSSSFKLIKERIDKIKAKQKDKTEFVYIKLPGLLYESCNPNIDDTFVSKLLKYLQADDSNMIAFDEKKMREYKKFVENIKFDSEDIDKTKVKQDKDYLDKVLFEKNLKAIKSAYFSDYMFNAKTPEDFFYSNSLLSLEETNKILKNTLSKFESFLKSIGINNIEELRLLLLKNEGFKNVDDLKNAIIKEYDELDKLLKEKNINLSDKLISTTSTVNFYKNEYPNLIKDKNIKQKFYRIGQLYVLFAITNDDYADGLDESWSGKQFFGDFVKGNSIIKIAYIYLFDSNKK